LENPELAIAALEAERIAIRANEDAIKDVSQARLLVKEAEQRLVEGNAALHDARQAVVEADYMVPRQLLPVIEKPRRDDLLAVAHARTRSDSMVLQLAKSDLARRVVRAPLERQLTENLRLGHRAQIAALTVRAPVAGVLQDFDVMPGAWLNPGQTVASIIGDGGLGARLEVYEADAARLSPGQPVRILVQSDTVTGKIDRIAPAAREGRVLIEVNLEASTIGLRPESSVNGEILVNQTQNVAVVRRPDWIREPGSYQMLCADSAAKTAEVCRIDVRAVGRASMIVDSPNNGKRLITGGTGPPYSASRYRLR
jgi:multidrug resistance efflux pump